jgi:hypothetical protein
MTEAEGRPGRVRPVERFRPTSGGVVGYLSLAVIAGLLLYLALSVHTMVGLRIFTGLLFLGVLVWVTQLRPRATVYPDRLELRNSLRDATVPLVLIDEVSVRRMLTVWVGEETYVCIGIGTPLRKMVKSKSRGPSSLLGWDRLEAYTERATPLRPDQSAMSYQEFVEGRLTDLVADARRLSPSGAGTTEAQPRRTWALPEIILLVGTGAAFVMTLLL